MTRGLAIYLGAALMVAWAILRAWDHFHGRPVQLDDDAGWGLGV